MRRLPIWPESGAERGAAERRIRLDAARQVPSIAAHLEDAIAAIRGADPTDGEALDRGHAALDRYLAGLSEHAGIDLRCSSGCSTCCADAPPTFAIEAERLATALTTAGDHDGRRRASEAASRMAELDRSEAAGDPTDPRFRRRQLDWRAGGTPCPLLVGQKCSQYARRPLACRVYASIEDPAHCDPAHPRFEAAERPPRWATPREFELEAALLDLGERRGLGRAVEPLPIALTNALARDQSASGSSM